jgi:hypothetical protein
MKPPLSGSLMPPSAAESSLQHFKVISCMFENKFPWPNFHEVQLLMQANEKKGTVLMMRKCNWRNWMKLD